MVNGNPFDEVPIPSQVLVVWPDIKVDSNVTQVSAFETGTVWTNNVSDSGFGTKINTVVSQNPYSSQITIQVVSKYLIALDW